MILFRGSTTWLTPSEGIQTSGLQNCERVTFCCFKTLSVVICYGSHRQYYNNLPYTSLFCKPLRSCLPITLQTKDTFPSCSFPSLHASACGSCLPLLCFNHLLVHTSLSDFAFNTKATGADRPEWTLAAMMEQSPGGLCCVRHYLFRCWIMASRYWQESQREFLLCTQNCAKWPISLKPHHN